MALNRFSNVERIMEMPTARLSGIPFTLGQHSNAHLQALHNGGNVALDASSFQLHNHVFSDGLTLFGQFGQIFPNLQAAGGHQDILRQKTPEVPCAQQHSPSNHDISKDHNAHPTRSNDGNSGKSSSHYASRHQAAEQRRRTRINERLDLLRKLVPHSDRANTASFLEEVIKYIDSLKARVTELESMQSTNTSSGKAGGHHTTPAPTPAAEATTSATLLRPDVQGSGYSVALQHPGTGSAILAGPSSGQHAQPLNVSYCLHQLQQQQLQQLLQQQHDAALTALQQQQEQHQQHKVIMAAHQLRQQQEIAAVRQATQMADLANQLGLKTMSQAQQGGSRPDPGMDGLFVKHASRDTRSSPLLLASTSAAPHTHSTALHHLMPVHHHVASAANDGTAATISAAIPAVEALKASTSTGSPVSSEESGVPLKKRKALLL